MDEKGLLNRWQILSIGLTGMFAGVVVGILFAFAMVV